MSALTDAVAVHPSERQIARQKREFYGFLPLGVNTFTGREWGEGSETPGLFAPTDLDARQWARAAKSAGMTALIFTCKNHDGFCLSPWDRHQACYGDSPGTAITLWPGSRNC